MVKWIYNNTIRRFIDWMDEPLNDEGWSGWG
jgi:hypothetical protein